MTEMSSMTTDPPRTIRVRLAVLATAFAVAVAILAVGAAQAADPFYENLMRKGTDQFNRGDYGAAVRSLRVAVFGFLDEPTLLADGLTRLALAQAAAGDLDGFRETFRRVEEVEARFQAYSKASIPPDVRKAFEAQVVRLIPEATLAANPNFARLVPKPEDRIAQLPRKERRKELERLIKSEPTKAVWFAMLASLEAAEGDMTAARGHADTALRLDPANKDALRARGLAESDAGQWAEAQRDLSACGAAPSDPQVAEALLVSLVELKRFDDAEGLAASLSPEVAKDERVQKARRRVREAKRAAAEKAAANKTAADKAAADKAAADKVAARKAAAETAAAEKPTMVGEAAGRTPPEGGAAADRATSTPVATRTPTPPVVEHKTAPTSTSTPPPPVALPAAARRDLSKAMGLADKGQLAEAFALAKHVADANPASREAQHTAAELAYRESRWDDALSYFRRGGDPGDDHPLRLFYLAVTEYETGHRDQAAKTLSRCLSKVRRTAYVEQYVSKITGSPSKEHTETP
jgi:tetratricopeptide (TPR) repeat protein